MADGAEVGQKIMQSTRCGAGIWGTFRWLANFVFAMCWIVALPVELVLNRRVGRRYSGLVPLLLSLVVLVPCLVLPLAVPTQSRWASSVVVDQRGLLLSILAIAIFLAAVLRQRIAGWWRFRSNEQVHSFSSGVPFWLHPPKDFMEMWGDEPKPGPEAAIPKPPAKPANKPATTFLGMVGEEITRNIADQWKPFVQQWNRGEVPTGPIAWFGATIVHPLALAVGAILLAPIQAVFAGYLLMAAAAIFLKARIQKALIIESIYDLFDARIEQAFTRELSVPQALNEAERAGLVVPGMVRAVASAESTPLPRGDLSPGHQALLTVPATIEAKNGSGSGAVSAGTIDTAPDWRESAATSIAGPDTR